VITSSTTTMLKSAIAICVMILPQGVSTAIVREGQPVSSAPIHSFAKINFEFSQGTIASPIKVAIAYL
jgi:hypothetical protein